MILKVTGKQVRYNRVVIDSQLNGTPQSVELIFHGANSEEVTKNIILGAEINITETPKATEAEK